MEKRSHLSKVRVFFLLIDPYKDDGDIYMCNSRPCFTSKKCNVPDGI